VLLAAGLVNSKLGFAMLKHGLTQSIGQALQQRHKFFTILVCLMSLVGLDTFAL
jgi:hypothetical protein